MFIDNGNFVASPNETLPQSCFLCCSFDECKGLADATVDVRRDLT